MSFQYFICNTFRYCFVFVIFMNIKRRKYMSLQFSFSRIVPCILFPGFVFHLLLFYLFFSFFFLDQQFCIFVCLFDYSFVHFVCLFLPLFVCWLALILFNMFCNTEINLWNRLYSFVYLLVSTELIWIPILLNLACLLPCLFVRAFVCSIAGLFIWSFAIFRVGFV